MMMAMMGSHDMYRQVVFIDTEIDKQIDWIGLV